MKIKLEPQLLKTPMKNARMNISQFPLHHKNFRLNVYHFP